jgi:RNA polymerase sigma-70 factor (family 1)
MIPSMTLPIPEDSDDFIRVFQTDTSRIEKAAVETDDERLLRETFHEDPKLGCSLLFRRYYVTLCNHAARFVHSRETAEDIVSEFFEIFWEQRIFEHPIHSYRSYLYTAIRHRAYNYLRWKVQPTDPLESMEFAPIARTIAPDDAMQYTELYLKVESIIQELSPQCRRAYLLKRVEGKKYEEIAGELQITTKAVEGLVGRALTRLRTGLKESWFLATMYFLLP